MSCKKFCPVRDRLKQNNQPILKGSLLFYYALFSLLQFFERFLLTISQV